MRNDDERQQLEEEGELHTQVPEEEEGEKDHPDGEQVVEKGRGRGGRKREGLWRFFGDFWQIPLGDFWVMFDFLCVT